MIQPGLTVRVRVTARPPGLGGGARGPSISLCPDRRPYVLGVQGNVWQLCFPSWPGDCWSLSPPCPSSPSLAEFRSFWPSSRCEGLRLASVYIQRACGSWVSGARAEGPRAGSWPGVTHHRWGHPALAPGVPNPHPHPSYGLGLGLGFSVPRCSALPMLKPPPPQSLPVYTHVHGVG